MKTCSSFFPPPAAALAILLAIAGLALAGPAAAAEESPPFAAPIAPKLLDQESCTYFFPDGSMPADRQVMLCALGRGNARVADENWRSLLRKKRHPNGGKDYHVRIAFKRPLKFRTILHATTGLRLLKADAPYPGDPKKPEHWQTIPMPPRQAGPYLSIAPRPMQSRVFLLTHKMPWHHEQPMPWLRLSQKRIFNATPVATVNAESEYTLRPEMGPPRTFAATDLTRGGRWQNAGPDKDLKRVLRPPISKLHPSWLVLSWDRPQRITGVILRGNVTQIKIYAFRGPDGVNPTVGGKKDWRLRRSKVSVTTPLWFRRTQIHYTLEPVAARGLRLKIIKTDDKAICQLDSVVVLTDLGDKPAPRLRKSEDLPPYKVTYKLRDDAIVTIALDTTKGVRVRNLMARRQRSAGANAAAWDLKDGNGQYVRPGKYQMVGIHHPGLEKRYQMTPYPNVNMYAPQNAPWITGHSGTGGWLADHSHCQALCTAGDRIYVGSPCAEDGLAMFEANLLGQKLWSRHNFIAWTGPQRMTSNGREVFVHAGTGSQDHIWGVDIKTKRTRTVWEPKSTSTRKRGIRGMVAKGDKLYLAVRGNYRWLVNAFGAADVDIENCQPKYKPKTKRSDRYAPDLREDFLRIFRLTGTRPGQNGGLTYLTSTKGPRAQQHVVLASKKPVPIGSLVFPMLKSKEISLRISLLKPNAKYPPNPDRSEDWLKLNLKEAKGWSVIAAPPKTRTRALRITFIKGDDDELADIMMEDDDDGDGGNAWSGQLEGMAILRRRYKNLFSSARVSVNSGRLQKNGEWDAHRKDPLSPENPGIYMLEWRNKQKVRGLAIKEIDGKDTQIDVFVGPARARADMNGDEHWKQVASYRQQRRYYYQPDTNRNDRARYMDGYVDFGEEYQTQAIRLRVVSQYTRKAEGRAGLYGVREDRGGMDLDPTRCRIYGVAPLQYLGGDTPVDPRIAERIEEFDVAAGKVTAEVHVPKPGYLNINSKGELYGISDGKLCKIDWPSGRLTPFPGDVKWPGAFDFDKQDNLYVFDWFKDRQNIRVYSPAGRLLRTIGTPGGFKMGLWDPTRMGRILAIAIDQKNQLWTVGGQFHPQRLTRWTLDGKVLSEHLGRTKYGGGGVLDPKDKSLLYYGPLEFKLDWKTGKTKLQAMTWIGNAEAGEQPIYVNNRKYMVNRGPFFRLSCGVVYLYENHKCKLVAAVGLADNFPPLNTLTIKKHLGKKTLAELQFTWSDLNGDQRAQLNEVKFAPRTIRSCQIFDDQLGIMAGNTRFQVKKFLPNGVPVYETVTMPFAAGNWLRMGNGNYFQMGSDNSGNMEGWTADGKKLWSYPSEGNGVHAYYSAKPLYPEQVVANFTIMGRGKAHAGDLGEFVVINTNSGIWHLWTADGLLVGNIYLDQRHHKARHWNFLEHDRNMLIENVTAGQEHFWGYVTRTADNRYYGVHRSTNVFEIHGMDKFKRFSQKITVTDKDIRSAVKWEKERQRRRVYREAKIYACYQTPGRIRIDGNSEDWEKVTPVMLFPRGDRGFNASFRLAYDQRTLFLCYETFGMGAFKNSGEDAKRMFKSGGCVDLKIATDAAADPTRKGPVKEDLRILMAPLRGKASAILYEAEKPGAPAGEQTTYATMVFRTEFDSVKPLPAARVAHQPTEHGYIVEAAIPIAALGLQIENDKLLKLDWGLIRTDQTGNGILGRYYWSNKATTIVSDIAAEAHLEPRLWGHVRFQGRKTSALDKAMPDTLFDRQGDTEGEDVDELLEEMKEELQ